MREVFRLTHQDHVIESQAAEIIQAIEDDKYYARNLILVLDFGDEVEVHADPSVPVSVHIKNLQDALKAMRECGRG